MKVFISWDEHKLDKLYTNLEKIMFDRQESGVLHNSFVWGNEIFDAIAQGDEKRLRQFLGKEIELGGETGILARDALRNWKNLAICYIANLTSKMIQNHILDEEHAYAISDACIQMIEGARTIDDVTQVLAAAGFLFCRHVKKRKAEYHPLAKKAKDYIFKHFHEKIVISEMAEQLGTSSTYLGQVFLKSEGVTLHDFILNEKIQKAKSWLTHTDYDMKSIGAYLGFSSQSHFAREFKRRIGQTPTEFREINNQTHRNKI